jgi:hypothetical protein
VGNGLTSAAAIIRQDRANVHRYGKRDLDDENDTFFADEGNRAVLEQMLDRGQADPGVLSRIVNGTPAYGSISIGAWTDRLYELPCWIEVFVIQAWCMQNANCKRHRIRSVQTLCPAQRRKHIDAFHHVPQ